MKIHTFDTPVPVKIVQEKMESCGLKNPGLASIRELLRLVNEIEAASGIEFIRMEMGVPGLEPSPIGIEAEITALQCGVASKYAAIEGVEKLKTALSRFARLFMNLNIDKKYCIPTTGSMQASMAAFLVGNQANDKKNKTLFIDPGFPVHKQQCRVLGHSFESFDIYRYRGEKLKKKLESFLCRGDIATLLYSNPNNPAWFCLTAQELSIIAELADKYEVIVLEDLAYFGMDFRQNYGIPGQPPYQPTIASYTDRYIILFSGSKAFSYAGQRIGAMLISPTLYNCVCPDLLPNFSTRSFGHAVVYGALYALSAGVTHSAQYGLAALIEAACDGTFDFINEVAVYGQRAKVVKKMLLENGFQIVYDRDIDRPIADGFYFTFSYPGFTGAELVEELLYYGISAISLEITHSERTEGLRACMAMISPHHLPVLAQRLSHFRKNMEAVIH